MIKVTRSHNNQALCGPAVISETKAMWISNLEKVFTASSGSPCQKHKSKFKD